MTTNLLVQAKKYYPRVFDSERHPDAVRRQDADDFHDSRRRYWSTASQLPALLNLPPDSFVEALRVLHGQPPKEPNEYAMTNFIMPGRKWEADIKQYIAENTTLGLFECGTFCWRFLGSALIEECIGASPDGLLFSNNILYCIEIKRRASLDMLSNCMPPLAHEIQIQTQLKATGLDFAVYMATARSNTLLARIEANPSLVQAMREDLNRVFRDYDTVESEGTRHWNSKDAQLFRYEHKRSAPMPYLWVMHPNGCDTLEAKARIAIGIEILLDPHASKLPEWLIKNKDF